MTQAADSTGEIAARRSCDRMKPRRGFLAALLAGAFSGVGLAQPSARPEKRRLGLLSYNDAQVFLDGKLREILGEMAKHGYVEGENLDVEARYANMVSKRLPDLAAELVALRVDAILTEGTGPTLAAQGATRSIPIICMVGDPVGSGFALEIHRPGGNITGLAFGVEFVARKKIELLRLMVPRLSAVGFIFHPNFGGIERIIRPFIAAASEVSIELRKTPVPDGIKGLEELRRLGIKAAFIGPVPGEFPDIARVAARHRIATIGPEEESVEQGMLAYMTSLPDVMRMPSILARVFGGANPATIPFELPTRYRTVINAKTAAALGISLTPELLLRADRLIR